MSFAKSESDVLSALISARLGVSRRHFDASIWIYVSNQKAAPQGRTTLQLPFDGAIAVA